MDIFGLTGIPKYYKGRLSEKITCKKNPLLPEWAQPDYFYRSECTGSAFQEFFFEDSSKIIIERLEDVLLWCSRDISKKCLYQEYLVMK